MIKADNKIILGLTLLLASAFASAQLPHHKTHLYAKITKGCQNIDWKNWKNPALKVFDKYNIQLEKVQLCNNKKYPVFIGKSKYRLSSLPNYGYANEFFISLLLKNSDQAYAFVETSAKEIMYVEKKSGEIYFEREIY